MMQYIIGALGGALVVVIGVCLALWRHIVTHTPDATEEVKAEPTGTPAALPPIALEPTIMTAEETHEINTVPHPPDINDPDHPLNVEWAELRAELLDPDE